MRSIFATPTKIQISDEKYNGGFVFGLPSENTEVFVESIKSSWKDTKQKTAIENPLLANNQIEKIVTHFF